MEDVSDRNLWIDNKSKCDLLMSNPNPMPQSVADILDAEAEVTAPMLAGVGQVGWMKTWPQLATYSHYVQLKSLVLGG